MRLLKALFLFTAILASNNIIAQCAFFAVVNNHGNSSYGIKNDGSLWVWGWNNYGQLGDGSTMDRINPVQVGTAKNWKFVAAGERFAFAINEDGKLFGWGWNAYGQLGDGTNVAKWSPIQVGSEFTAVTTGPKGAIRFQSQ